MFEQLDFYCERLAPGLLAEPVNLASNLAFVAAGLWGLAQARRRRADTFVLALCWWAIAVGIGSAAFHSFANELTKWADILPIAGFTVAYTLLNLRRFVGISWAGTIAGVTGFYVVAGIVTALVPVALRAASNGSTGYLPPFLALICFGIYVIAKGNRAGWYNIAAAAIFCVSVTFRAIDPLVCGAFPLGTHFLWHALNGIMLGVLLAAALRHGIARPAERI